ncbi:MAG: DNA polymerase Y family protein [Devosia sp.]
MASTLSTSQTQIALLPQRRYLALSLPRWATDWLKRHDADLSKSTLPLGLWERQSNAMRIVALDEKASAAGLTLGQSVSDVRALVPNLELREIDHAATEAAFAELADWHSYASPLVSVLTDATPYGDLVMDITGVSHLFGGDAAMLEAVTGRLTSLGIAVTGAIAPSIGAAWALVRQGRQLVLDNAVRIELQHLPVAALRLDESQVMALNQIGLKSIGQLYGRPRKELQSRFGSSLLLRLDQALGIAEERLVPRLPEAEMFVERRFADPIGLLDDVIMCAHDLAVSLACRLEALGAGAKSFHLFLYRVDHKVMTFSVNAGRATRDADHVGRLFAYRAERLGGEYDAGFGIDMIRLAASSIFPLDIVQESAFSNDTGAETLERLFDRMTSKLGPLAVLRNAFVNTYIPEQAVKLEPVIATTEDDPLAAHDPQRARPIRLLPQPEPINVIAQVPDGPPARMVWRRVGYQFVRASGPERIAAEWWASKALPVLTARGAEQAITGNHLVYDEAGTVRDYYIAEDDGGRRFWLFRVGLYGGEVAPGWFMHGFFA